MSPTLLPLCSRSRRGRRLDNKDGCKLTIDEAKQGEEDRYWEQGWGNTEKEKERLKKGMS